MGGEQQRQAPSCALRSFFLRAKAGSDVLRSSSCPSCLYLPALHHRKASTSVCAPPLPPPPAPYPVPPRPHLPNSPRPPTHPLRPVRAFGLSLLRARVGAGAGAAQGTVGGTGMPLEDVPSYRQGYGRLDLRRALPLPGSPLDWRLQARSGQAWPGGPGGARCKRGGGRGLASACGWL